MFHNFWKCHMLFQFYRWTWFWLKAWFHFWNHEILISFFNFPQSDFTFPWKWRPASTNSKNNEIKIENRFVHNFLIIDPILTKPVPIESREWGLLIGTGFIKIGSILSKIWTKHCDDHGKVKSLNADIIMKCWYHYEITFLKWNQKMLISLWNRQFWILFSRFFPPVNWNNRFSYFQVVLEFSSLHLILDIPNCVLVQIESSYRVFN